jgi:Type I phosphodiesterase / nucleotide pyrophosphatase
VALRRAVLAGALVLATGVPVVAAAAAPKEPRVVLITIDGLRWQEFFGGGDPILAKAPPGSRAAAIPPRYLTGSAARRRSALMPFVWSTIAVRGQIFGDPSVGSPIRLTNGFFFSYPSYNEILSGSADPRINSNNKIPNPNMTVLEWLNQRPDFSGKVVAFATWDVIPFILNTERSRVPVGSTRRPVPDPRTEKERAINTLALDLPRYWDYTAFDAPLVYAAMESMRSASPPRVLYLSLGEVDEWAHEGRYDLYLDAARRSDAFIERIWTLLQSLPAYRNNTTLIVTTDHGRGEGESWSNHGRSIPVAGDIWVAVLGPRVPPRGVRRGTPATAAQIAATIALAVGLDFPKSVSRAAPPLPIY